MGCRPTELPPSTGTLVVTLVEVLLPLLEVLFLLPDPMGMSLCLCLEDMTSWPDDQEEWVLLVLVGEVLEIMAMSLELQEEVMLGLEWDCEWWWDWE